MRKRLNQKFEVRNSAMQSCNFAVDASLESYHLSLETVHDRRENRNRNRNRPQGDVSRVWSRFRGRCRGFLGGDCNQNWT
jgi:hypothetical protein